MEGKLDSDAIVIGAGFGGLRLLHELRELGLSAKVFEAASDVGGTWDWNRYPGARTDSESWVYAYSFSKELQDEWSWSERFPPQAEALAYLRHVADRFDMRKDIAFNTRVESAVYDESARVWTVRDDQGGRHTCTYLISAVGVLSTPYVPPFPGYVARHQPSVRQVVMAYFGLQYLGEAPAQASAALQRIAAAFTAGEAPGHWDRASLERSAVL